jgi:hypothetical protein
MKRLTKLLVTIGGGIVQAIGTLKILADSGQTSSTASQRFLIVTDIKDSSQVALLQADAYDVGNSPTVEAFSDGRKYAVRTLR